jgi:hypothetical protein
MSRTFWLPTTRTFSLSGTARVSALIPDNVIDSILGGPKVFGGAVIGSNERLPGDLNARAVFAFDGNPKTFWSPGFDGPAQIGAWMQASLTHSISFNHLDLKVIADGRHSVPTEIRITTNTGGDELVPLPTVRDRKAVNSVVSVPISFPQLSGTTIRITIEAVRQVKTMNWYTQKPIVMPVGIAEIGLPGVHFTPEPTSAKIPSVCTPKLLRIDGRPVWLKISGTVGAAEKLRGLTVSGCGPDANGIVLGPGNHTLDAAWGKTTGWDLDRVVLDSAPGGAVLPPLADGSAQPASGTIGTPATSFLPTPTVRVLGSTATSAKLEVQGATRPFWLVLGESLNAGWEATWRGGRSLGAPQLIDGYANGWYVSPQRSSTFVVTLEFAPQGIVTPAVIASGATLALCLFLGFVPIGPIRRRLRRRGPRSAEKQVVEPAGGTVTADPGSWDASPTRHSQTSALGASPVLGSPLATSGEPPKLLTCILVAAACGAIAMVVLPPSWAPSIAGATAVLAIAGLRWSRARSVLSLSAVGCIGAAGAVTVFDQVRHHYPPGSAWPHNFETAGVLAFVGVVALATDMAVELARRHRLPDNRDSSSRHSSESS